MDKTMRVMIGVLATFGAGLVGYLFVDTDSSSWYAALAKPPFNPPGSVVLIVWLLLYAFMSAALALIWTREPQRAKEETWIRFYFVQLLFNATWTMFFFGLHAMLLAFLDLIVLGFIIVCLIAGAGQTDKRAAYLLAPYLAWLLFAAYLNLGIWFMN